ncbi:SLATT domain-containing protein [Streptomyces sp. NPDC050504]|uniref:SLATT domain-containing protein n=1 Tax=Streptomyces sp. NPDC050504 TaxID=3365618 RepID=UPI00379FDF61
MGTPPAAPSPAPLPAARPTDSHGRRDLRNLRNRPFPALTADTLRDRNQALQLIRDWAEREAEEAIDWYFRDKRLKRVGSRIVRGLTVALAVAGTAVPLADAANGGGAQGWGYVLLAVAAGCKGFDHFFGLSSGWMRDIAAAQALQGELSRFRMAWSGELLRGGDGPLEPAALERRLKLITRLVTAVRTHVESETADWLTEFRSTAQQLQAQAPPQLER